MATNPESRSRRVWLDSGFAREELAPWNDEPPKRKRTNSRWPSDGDNSPANRPDPDDPGGLGAEESGTERTGPTQDSLFAMQEGGRWAEVGRYYDSANDPVTEYFQPDGGQRTIGRARKRMAPAMALLQRPAVGAIM